MTEAQEVFVLILVGCQLGDLLTTIVTIRAGGYEANRLMAKVADWFQRHQIGGRWAWVFWTKLLLAVLIWFALSWFTADQPTEFILGCTATFYLALVLDNYLNWKHQREINGSALRAIKFDNDQEL